METNVATTRKTEERERRSQSRVRPGKLLESQKLQQQAANNTKQQFATSPDLNTALTNAIMDALDAHTSMSKQALNSPAIRSGIKDILLNHSGLWETLRERAIAQAGDPDVAGTGRTAG